MYSPETYDGHWKQLTVRTTRTKQAMAIAFFNPQVRKWSLFKLWVRPFLKTNTLLDLSLLIYFDLLNDSLETWWRGNQCIKELHEEALHGGRGERQRSNISLLCQRGSKVWNWLTVSGKKWRKTCRGQSKKSVENYTDVFSSSKDFS